MSRATVVAQGASHWAALMLALSLAIWFTETPAQAQASPGLEHTPYGVRAQEGGETLEITALREDAVRVRMWQGTAEPEDASWAILPEALHRRAKVIAEAAGFSTGKLHAAIGPYLALTVTDNAGQIFTSRKSRVSAMHRMIPAWPAITRQDAGGPDLRRRSVARQVRVSGVYAAQHPAVVGLSVCGLSQGWRSGLLERHERARSLRHADKDHAG